MITANFQAAVRDDNLMRVHIMMKDSLLTDPSFRTFAEMEQAASGMEGLYVPHDGTVLSLDEATWTKDYMNELLVDVVDNFSRERIEHLKKVVQKLHPMQAGRKVVIEQSIGAGSEKKSRPERHRASDEHPALPLQRMLKGAAAGAVILGTAGILKGAAGIFGGALTGALVGGGLAYVTRTKRRQIR